MRRGKPRDAHGLARQGAHGEERARLDAIAHDGVGDGVKLVNALHLDDGRPGALDLGAHLVEEVGEVHDLGLARRVVDRRRALGEDGGHHEVLGGAHAREGERDRVPRQAVGSARVDVAVIDLELDAERLKAEDVHVDLARADVAAAGHGDDGAAEAGEQGAEHRRRGAHLGDEMVGGLPGVHFGRVDLELVLVHDLDPRPDVLEDLAHHVDVGDVGDVGERRHPRRHDGGGHELERRVFCSLDPHRTRDAMATLYANDVHVPSVLDRS